MDGIERLLQPAYRADSDGFVPFSVGEQVVGWLRPLFAKALQKWPQTFEHDSGGAARLREDLDDEPKRTRALSSVVRDLAKTGLITGWRDELYPVRSGISADEKPLLFLERAAARPFGITSYAVHVNGIVDSDHQRAAPAIWIARRSLSKAIDPGMLDNMIGGGVPAGLSVRETLVKEAWEEAGLNPQQVAPVKPGRRLRIPPAGPERLQSG